MLSRHIIAGFVSFKFFIVLAAGVIYLSELMLPRRAALLLYYSAQVIPAQCRKETQIAAVFVHK